MTAIRCHQHTFGKADLADLRALADFCAAHEDSQGADVASMIRNRLDGDTLELSTNDWNWLSNWVYVAAGAWSKAKQLEQARRIIGFVDLISRVLAREPTRTVEIQPATETAVVTQRGATERQLTLV